MGMSASQARYLSLTARKSDLEFRGQQINQSRLMLSNQSANLYSSMLTMSVPTPPVETDFMKDVYTFSMGGDNTTLSSYKLSMGKDGYGYDILYSKPATTKQLTASSVSDVQRAITRQASKTDNNTMPASGIKVATKYDDSKADQKSAPNVSRLVKMSSNNIKGGDADIGGVQPTEKDYNTGYTIYNKIHGESTSKATTKPLKNNIESSSILEKMSINNNTLVYSEEKDGEKKTKDYYNVTVSNLAKIFGGTFDNSKNTYTYTNSILSNVLSGLGSNDTITVGTDKDNVSFYINTDDMTFYVIKADSDKELKDNADKNLKDTNATVYKYNLATLLGLQNADDVKDLNEKNEETGKKVYSYVTGKGVNAEKNYYTFNWDTNITTNNGLQFNTVKNPNSWKINDKDLIKINDNLEEKFGITPNKNVTGDTNTDNKNYQYFRDSNTGDIWELCTTTSTSGSISESWKLFKPNKTYTFGDKEAQLLDEKDWPTGISHTYKSGGYDCFYVPDETGTGGSYYMVQQNAFTYDQEHIKDIQSSVNGTRFAANNTYKIEGLTACVVSNDNIPSTILDAYDKDNYIVYATYNDKDTDFSDPVKYYVFPKDDDAANAVCSYAYEKSYTGKNELLQARANILVDENGRLSKIDILNQGTYALEYGQEKDEDAYNEAYREYEYKLQKYEQEMSAIDAKTALIQQQDKKLELQLKSIDTEHSAIQTELEALKKVIDTNIKSSFGTFGG